MNKYQAKRLVELANVLDEKGFHKMADEVDDFIKNMQSGAESVGSDILEEDIENILELAFDSMQGKMQQLAIIIKKPSVDSKTKENLKQVIKLWDSANKILYHINNLV